MQVRSRHVAHGVPYARSRVILLFLATRAVDAGPTFTGRLADIASMFQLPWPVANIKDHFLRVTHAEYTCSAEACACAPLPCRGEHRIAYSVRHVGDGDRFAITVSDEFLMSAQLGMRCPRREIRELILARQLAALDLLLWYRWQEHEQVATSMDPLGAGGPFRRIKSAAARTRKRDEIVRLHDVVASVWHDCRYNVTRDGKRLTYEPPERASAPDALDVNGGQVDVIFPQPAIEEEPP